LPRLGRDGRPGDTLPNALAIQYSANSDYRKEIVAIFVATIFRRGLGPSAASHAPTRKPTAATAAPCNFDGAVCDAEGRGGPVEKVWRRLRAAKFGNSYPLPVNP
jgi:hypothetical protein